MGLYAGEVGLYAGEVGLYAGEVGLYAAPKTVVKCVKAARLRFAGETTPLELLSEPWEADA